MKNRHKWTATLFTCFLFAGQVLAATLNEPGYSETLFASVPDSVNSFGSMAMDSADNIYTAGGWTNEVYKVTPGGVVSQFGTTGGDNAMGMAVIGDTLFVGFDSGEIRTMDLTQVSPNGALLASVSGAAMGMAIAPAGFGAYGGQLVVGTYNGISIVHPTTGAVTVLLSTPGQPHSDLGFTPGGQLLATDYNSNQITQVSDTGIESVFHAAVSDPDGLAIHPSTGEVFVASSDLYQIIKISADGLSASVFASDAFFDPGWYVSPIRFSSDASKLYYGVNGTTMEIFEISGFDWALLGVNSGTGGGFLAEIDIETAALTNLGPTGLTIDGIAMGNGILYAADNDNDRLVTLDPATGAVDTVIGPYGSASTIEAMAFRASDNTLFGINLSGEDALVTFNLGTGELTAVGLLGDLGSDQLAGLSFTSDGTLWGIAYGTGTLYTIDPATGAATLVAVGAGIGPLGLAAHPVTDVLYTTDFQGGGDDLLQTVDPVTAVRTTIGPMPGGLQIEGLTFRGGAAMALPVADLSISKMDSLDPVVAGTNLTYTLRVDNIGTADAADVVVTDTLPPGVTLVSTSGCAEDPVGVPTCTLGSIVAGGFAEYSVTVAVDPSTIGLLINAATVATSSTESDLTNNATTEETTVTAEADLSITKMDSADPFVSGSNQVLVYTIEVSNAGPSDATNVVVTDTLPPLVTSYYTSGCLNDPGGVPDCQLGTIPAGGSASYTITVGMPRSGGLMSNVVSVTSDATDPVGDNDWVEESTEVVAIPIPTLNSLGLLVLILLVGGIGWVSVRRF